MTSSPTVRVDMHCHSTASQEAKLGIQGSLGLPECATPPEEVYELAKSRGMDFVTITDHDTIDGCLEIADRPDVFVSEELTAWFKDEPQAVHVLCYGITPADHEFLQANAADLETCAAYLHQRGIACALAHPFFFVTEPLEARHRRRLAELFGVWEVRNGSRAPDLNSPAAVYIDTHGGVGIGGSDDHAGVDIGRTWTETPCASTPEQLLAHIRSGEAHARGDQGSAAKWAHSALGLAVRSLLDHADPLEASAVRPDQVLQLAMQVVSDGAVRGGAGRSDLGPEQGRALLLAWLDSVGLGSPRSPREVIDLLQGDEVSHADLYRRARRIHESRLRDAVEGLDLTADPASELARAGNAVFEACLPVVPYVPSMSILAGERARLRVREGEPRRVGLVVDGAGSVHGVTRTVERIREHGVPGYEVEVIGTDARVDRRLPAVADVELPFYSDVSIGIPSIADLVETLADGAYDLLHLVSPGPAGVAAALAARIGHTPICASYHTELAAYAGIRTSDSRLEAGMGMALALFYGQGEVVLSPSASADASLEALGIDPERIARWVRGVDTELFGERSPDRGSPDEVRVLYAGRLAREKGVELMAESFLRAHERDPRLHLVLAGGGPEEGELRSRLGERATFLGWLDRELLASAYARADIFLFGSRTDTYGQVITEAQASGLPVVAVGEGGPASLIRDRVTGWLCRPDAEEMAAAVAQLAASPFLRERIGRAAEASVRERTWETAIGQLAAGYARALRAGAGDGTVLRPVDASGLSRAA